MQSLSPLVSASVTALFKDVDTDNSGSIDMDEMGVLLKKLEIDASTREIELLFSSLDSDSNGTIDLEEFSVWYSMTHNSITQTSNSIQEFLSTYPKTLTFDPTLHVPSQIIQQAIAASRNVDLNGAPLTWRNIIVTPMGGMMEKLETLNEEATPDDWRPWESSPYLLIMVDSVATSDPSAPATSSLSIGQSMQNFMLSLQAEGIATTMKTHYILHPSSTSTSSKARELLNIKEGEEVKSVIMFGFARSTIKKKRGGNASVHTTIL